MPPTGKIIIPFHYIPNCKKRVKYAKLDGCAKELEINLTFHQK